MGMLYRRQLGMAQSSEHRPTASQARWLLAHAHMHVLLPAHAILLLLQYLLALIDSEHPGEFVSFCRVRAAKCYWAGLIYVLSLVMGEMLML